ncbi:carbonic anhydrase [Nocardioides albertanoniae]|uniref:Carbonic anhydrase n=1 Tax=Nocardioides albertanoniae TaxID=1175486 RepID=A0A543AC44_9ACTN|nr:bifunctional SulP family inorganic anion transporter/carbonic anhydrase [Nocardioides albertanoniae]TQL70168.1 carbonic anhydrase [Nocardioides albertanoniae]
MSSTDPTLRPGRPRPRDQLRQIVRFDVPASLVVFLVAVPLSLGIAVASGAPVAAGLIAAAAGGIVAGLFGGSPLQVSGPAAGLTVVVAEIVAEFGWEATCAITLMAGLLQVVLGATRLGRYALAISPTVVSAMLAAIGISIVLGQLNVALGGRSQSSALDNLEHILVNAREPNIHAILAGLGVIVILLAWPRLPQRVRAVPGQLVAIVALTLLAAAWLPGAERVHLGGDLLDEIGSVALPEGTPLAVAGAVLTVALIASVESLLSAVAVDRLHGGPRSNLDRELLGQGLANSASGALGGLPVTGVIVRSSTNVTAGARTRASAILHGVWVLVFALVLVELVEQIPLAALAGLLIMMGTGLVRPADISQARARGELWIYALTVVGVLALNLIEGVLIGLVATLVLVLWRLVHVRIDVRLGGRAADGREKWLVEVHGSLSFLATPTLMTRLDSIPEGQVVELDLLVDYLDPAGRDQLDQWRARYVAGGGSVLVEHSGLHGAEAPRQERALKAPPISPRALLPWSAWQDVRPERSDPHHPLALGVREYHRRQVAPLRGVYEGLLDGHEPHAVFLTCVDSQVVPNLITSSGPGDLLTVRTMGNLVPEPGSPDSSVAAPVLFGVDDLGVSTVVVCGHSHCGAITSALESTRAGAVPEGPVGDWLRHATPAIQEWRAGHPVGAAAAGAGRSEVDQVSQVNVAVMIDRLGDLLGDRDVRLVGLFLDISDGKLQILRGDAFTTLTDAETDELAHLMETRPEPA